MEAVVEDHPADRDHPAAVEKGTRAQISHEERAPARNISVKNLDKILAFTFGVVFCSALLALAVFIPNPTETTLFIFRVVLALASAGVGSVIPGLLRIDLPYIRAGGAVGLAIVVYFFNPPALVTTSLEKRTSQLINEGRFLISRGNFESAIEKLRQAQQNTYSIVDIPFYLGVIEKRQLRYRSAEDYFRSTLTLMQNGHKIITDLTDADVMYEIGMMLDGAEKFEEAYSIFKKASEAVGRGTYLESDIVFELGRLALFVWLRESLPEKVDYLRASVQHFGLFSERDWPHQQSKIWGNYHLACAYSELARIATRSSEREMHLKQAEKYAKMFSVEANSLEGQRKFEFRIVVYMIFNSEKEYLPGIPLACSSPIDMTNYRVVYRS